MLLRDFIWKVFQSTGQIEVYLMYCSCTTGDEQLATLPAHTQSIASLN